MALTDPRKLADQTSAALAANATYTGPWVDALKYRRVSASARGSAGTMVIHIQQSVSPTMDYSASLSSGAGFGVAVETTVVSRYVRMVIDAGTSAQNPILGLLILS